MTSELKSWPAPWQGDLLLACRKCQKKLKKHSARPARANLKKAVKRLNRKHPAAPLHVLNVPCMKLCPKDAVTICDPRRSPSRLAMLRSDAEIDSLYRDTTAALGTPSSSRAAFRPSRIQSGTPMPS